MITDDLRPDPAGTHALAAWSLVHGLSNLVVDGRVLQGADHDTIRSVASHIGASLIEGLAIEAGK